MVSPSVKTVLLPSRLVNSRSKTFEVIMPAFAGFLFVQFLFLSLFLAGWMAFRHASCAQSPNCG